MNEGENIQIKIYVHGVIQNCAVGGDNNEKFRQVLKRKLGKTQIKLCLSSFYE